MKGYIYLIRNKDLYKIGITQNFDQRMKSLRPDEIIRVLKTNRYQKLERELHKKYKSVRIPQTEYFRLSKSMVRSCKNKLSDYSYRRSKSNPWLIAITTVMLTPEICIIWAIRHRSLNLAILSIGIIFTTSLIYSAFELTELANLYIKLIAGTIAFVIVKRNKFKEHSKKGINFISRQPFRNREKV